MFTHLTILHTKYADFLKVQNFRKLLHCVKITVYLFANIYDTITHISIYRFILFRNATPAQ